MCGRYLIDDEAFDIQEIIAAAERNAHIFGAAVGAGVSAATGNATSTCNAAGVNNVTSVSNTSAVSNATDYGIDSPVWPTFRSGEIFPGNVAPVLAAEREARFMLWGFPNLMPGKRPLINARSETAAVKRTFSDAMASRRCLVPASGYYEWKTIGKKHKEKYEFTLPDRETMYMAGIYSREGQFAILTRAASPSTSKIHDRMPVILPKILSDVWLSESADVILEALTELQSRHIPGKNEKAVQMSMFN